MLIHVLTVSPFMMNCYMLVCEQTNEAIVIDAGDEGERILQFAESKNYKLQYIINTHAHVDHVSAVAAIQNKINLPFLLHEKEKMVLEMLVDTQKLYSIGDGLMPKVSEYIDPEKRYTFGNEEIQIIETPGHTPGGVCLLIGNDIFVGDTLFAGSIGRTDLPGGSTETLLNSIKTKLMPLDDKLVVHSGHGPETTIGDEKRLNPFLQ
ncbi:MAG: MBL fold metallo-hydrolase [Proteobacteria bacterium]|nr:MBL fold metallo-hydrolase [Pseudomonadota bacterium]